MAAITPTVTNGGDFSVKKFLFEGLVNGDTTSPIPFAEWADRSIQVTGTFDTTTVIAEGSNDGGTTYAALTDYQGNAVSFTAAGLEGIQEITELMRARVTAGGASTDIDVHILLRRQTPNRG
jgi:hypothetical protein